MVPTKAYFLMAGPVSIQHVQHKQRFRDFGIGTIWQHELHHGTSQLHYVCQCIATDHSQEKMKKMCCLGRPTACLHVGHVHLFVGLSWLMPEGRTAPKIGDTMIDGEAERKNYEFIEGITKAEFLWHQ